MVLEILFSKSAIFLQKYIISLNQTNIIATKSRFYFQYLH